MAYWLLIISTILYVYRIYIYGVNISLFRILFIFWWSIFLKDVILRKVVIKKSFFILFLILIPVFSVNMFDLARLDGHHALIRDALNHLGNIALVFLVALYINNEKKLNLFIKYFIFSSLLAFLIAAWGAYFEKIPFEEILVAMKSEYISELEYVNIYESLARWTSSFYDPNFYGLYSCFVLIFCLYQKYFLHEGKGNNFFFVVNFVALALTASRSAYFGFAVIAVLTLWRMRMIPRVLSWKIPIILLGMILLILFESDLRLRFFNPESLQDRWRYIENGIGAFWENPILGVSSAGLLNEEIRNPSTHIVYLSLLAKYGIIGFLCYLPFLFYPLYYVIFANRKIEEKYKYLIMTTYLSLLIMYLGYDYFQILEFQYLVFGVMYSIALNKIGTLMGR